MIDVQCIDALKGLQALGEESIDVIVTSPPYNLGIDYNSYDDTISRQGYLDWMLDVAFAMLKALKKDGSLFINLGSKPTDPWLAHDVAALFRRMFVLQNNITWVKSVTIDEVDDQGPRSFGHFKPLNSPRFVNDCWESIFHFTKTGQVPLDRLAVGVPYEDKSNVKRWQSLSNTRCRGNVWFIPYKTIQKRSEDRPHPATFPIALVEKCMKLHGLERIELACDPFVGLGSSAMAATNLDVNFIGFDIDPYYCEQAQRRLEEAIP